MYTEETRSLCRPRNPTLGYRMWRPGKRRRLIILIHGMASNLTRWSEFVDTTSLKEGLDIIRIDLRGHGSSQYRGYLSMKTWCKDIADIMQHEGYDNAIIVGHSLGAQVAMNFASLQPEKSTGLILIDPLFYESLDAKARRHYRLRFLTWIPVIIIMALNQLGIYRRHIPARDLWELDKNTRTLLLDSGKKQEMIDNYSSPWPDLKHFPVANYLQEYWLSIKPTPAPATLKLPVLVLLAVDSGFGDASTSKDIIKTFPDVSIVDIDAYHWPLTEKPVETREAIENWITEKFTGH